MNQRNRIISLTILIALAALGGMRAASQTVTRSEDGIDYRVLTEQIEIMRRVWTHDVSDRFGELIKEDQPDDKGASSGATGADEGEATGASALTGRGPARAPQAAESGFGMVWRDQVAAIAGAENGQYRFDYSATSGTQGLYLPGRGIVYSTDIQIPLRAVSKEQADQGKGQSDAWEEARQSVRGNNDSTVYTLTSALNRTDADTYALDERYIDAAVQSILTSIARYGGRIDQLPGSESITVAVRLNPQGRGGSAFFFTGLRAYVNSNGGDDDQVGRLVIEVPHSALGKDLDAAQLKSQCRITRY